MNEYFRLEPEVAGGLGEDTVLDSSSHPPLVSELHYEFSGWMGDDLVESFPCYVVTERCGRLMEKEGLTGFSLAEVKVSRSAEFVELHSDRVLPRFFWLKVEGVAGEDDFALSKDHILMVSKRALDTLETLHLDHCDIERA